MKYSILLVDPPWKYRDEKSNLPELGGKTYDTMDDTALSQLPIAAIAEENALCFCWMVMPKLEEGFSVLRSWGFTPITCGFVWVKLNRNSAGVEHGELLDPNYKTRKGLWLDGGVYSGLGSYTCGNVELCYIGKRGKGVPRQDKSVKQLVFAPLGRHSAKPIEVHRRIDQLYAPEYRRVELFARERPYAEHWDATGLEYDGQDIREFANVAV